MEQALVVTELLIGASVPLRAGKVVRLKHGAPVMSLSVVDRAGYVLPAPLETEHQRARPADMTGEHQLIVCSQQQLKV